MRNRRPGWVPGGIFRTTLRPCSVPTLMRVPSIACATLTGTVQCTFSPSRLKKRSGSIWNETIRSPVGPLSTALTARLARDLATAPAGRTRARDAEPTLAEGHGSSPLTLRADLDAGALGGAVAAAGRACLAHVHRDGHLAAECGRPERHARLDLDRLEARGALRLPEDRREEVT